jgi:hypothetical protein
MFKRLFFLIGLPLFLAAGEQTANAATTTVEAYRTQSHRALNELLTGTEARDTQGDAPRALRDRAILAVVQAANNGLQEQTLEALAGYREQHPDDLYAKMYEGYGWLFCAGEYVKKQNYFRAAELAKRGFFLMDEAVDQNPDDWRLHLLRARLDVYVPAEFGRHVVALKDLRYLTQSPDKVPAELTALLDFLLVRAYSAAGQTEQAQPLIQALQRTPPWAELLQQNQPRLFLTAEEIQYVLAPIVAGEQ